MKDLGNPTYFGIDNGIAGGLAFYKPDQSEVFAYPMPVISVKKAKGNKNEYNIPEIIRIIKQYPDIKVAVLEKSQAFPGQSVQSTFSFAKNFGIMQGILAALEIPHIIVHPKSWQKVMFAGLAHQDTKQASVLVAQRWFPTARFVANEKATKLHNGMTDAALMAVYGTKI